ncbi:ribokinase [Novosphingobium olei]|uniref:Ribokinase n=1 Tax=Novosphingobium olei TaxID=2728851 RepID=A0A7Y0G8Y3_9SPHN|nr:ribokinase [Novosphingobium olei]NML93410.1 ribokinase [Novosphingobium olei]
MTVVVFGSINRDLVMRVRRLPLAGETVAAYGLELLPGGKGANQATASALHGAPTLLIGAVGDDAHGAAMLAGLTAAGVDSSAIVQVAGPTGLAHVFVSDEGENQIVIVTGANGEARAPLAFPSCADHAVAVAQAEVPASEVARFLALARDAGACTLFNPAPANAEGAALIALADMVVLNETELAFFTGGNVSEGDDAVEAAARRLMARDRQWVVVTLGGEGVLACGPGETLRIAAPKVAVVDTTGAGDTFCGVLAARLSEGAGMAQALQLACIAASLSVQRVGAAASMPTRAEVEAALVRS